MKAIAHISLNSVASVMSSLKRKRSSDTDAASAGNHAGLGSGDFGQPTSAASFGLRAIRQRRFIDSSPRDAMITSNVAEKAVDPAKPPMLRKLRPVGGVSQSESPVAPLPTPHSQNTDTIAARLRVARASRAALWPPTVLPSAPAAGRRRRGLHPQTAAAVEAPADGVPQASMAIPRPRLSPAGDSLPPQTHTHRLTRSQSRRSQLEAAGQATTAVGTRASVRVQRRRSLVTPALSASHIPPDLLQLTFDAPAVGTHKEVTLQHPSDLYVFDTSRHAVLPPGLPLPAGARALMSMHKYPGMREACAQLAGEPTQALQYVVCPLYRSRGKLRDAQMVVTGKSKEGEGQTAAATRELREEIGLVPRASALRAVMDDGRTTTFLCAVGRTTPYTGRGGKQGEAADSAKKRVQVLVHGTRDEVATALCSVEHRAVSSDLRGIAALRAVSLVDVLACVKK